MQYSAQLDALAVNINCAVYIYMKKLRLIQKWQNKHPYIQVMEQIRSLVESGAWSNGMRLSERWIAKECGVSRSTASKALLHLRDEGLVTIIPSSGTHVSCKQMSASSITWERIANRAHIVRDSIDRRIWIGNTPRSSRDQAMFSIHKDFNAKEPLIQAMHALYGKGIDDSFFCTDMMGHRILRNTVAKHLQKDGIHTNPNNIIIFSCFIEAVSIISKALLNHGVNVYFAQHNHFMSLPTLFSYGVNMHSIATDNEGIIPEVFENKLKPGQGVLVLTTIYDYPTGITTSEKRLKQIYQICRKNRIIIIENAMLRDLWCGAPIITLKSLDKHDQVIFIGTMINNFNTSTYYVWTVVPDAILPQIMDAKTQNSPFLSGLNSAITNEMLEGGYYNAFLERLKGQLPGRARVINNILQKRLTGLAKWHPECSIFNLWLEFQPEVNTELFLDKLSFTYVPGRVFSGKPNYLYTTALAFAPDELDEMMGEIAIQTKKQLKKPF